MHKEFWCLQREITSYCDFAIQIDILEKKQLSSFNHAQVCLNLPRNAQKVQGSEFFFLMQIFHLVSIYL